MPRATVVDMTRRPHPPRSASVVIAALLATALMTATLTGCGPAAPTPTPTPTGFASEEEAFAAAEATYRAYVDALNQVDLSDPTTFEEVYRWTTGDANAAERESLSSMHADGWVVSGESDVTAFYPEAWGSDGAVKAIACVEVSEVSLVDKTGTSVVPSDRPPSYALELVFVTAGNSPTGLVIDNSEAIEDPRCATP